jgi:hypothetical protein
VIAWYNNVKSNIYQVRNHHSFLKEPQKVTDKPEYEPNSNYTIRKIEGWKVYVNYRLIDENKKLCKEALRLMRVKLYDINRVVPKPALKHLHKVSIWLEFNNEQVLCACYL